MEEVREAMLTTIDNPYNPFTQYDEWEAFDTGKGYHTNQYLGRIAITSNALSEADLQLEIQRAIDEIVELNILGIYTKVYKDELE